MRYFITLLILTFFFLSTNLFSQTLFQPNNLNFEKGQDSSYVMSWVLPRKVAEAGYYAMLTKNNPSEGELCMLLSSPDNIKDPEDLSKDPAPMYQVIDALQYQGKKVRISVMARLESKDKQSSGELWLIGRQTKENITVSKYLEDDLIKSNTWNKYEFTCEIPENTNEIRYGVILRGMGKLYIDDFKIDIIQPDGATDEPSKKLSDKSINNLVAFAKSYGYLNFFNPANKFNQNSDARVTLWAIEKAENAKDDKELIKVLSNYAEIMSPKSIVDNKSKSTISYDKPANCPDHLALVRQNTGGAVDRNDDIFSSITKNIFASNRSREASVTQTIEVIKLRGKKLNIGASIKVEQQSPGANAQIWVLANRVKKSDNIIATTVQSPAMSGSWKRYETSIELPDDVYTVKIALVFIGEGRATFDDVKIDILENNKKIGDIPVANFSFEELDDKGFPKDWALEESVISAGYKVYSDPSNSTKGKFSISMESELNNRIAYPIIGKIYSYPLSNNIWLHQPLVYFANDSGSVPQQHPLNIDYKSKPTGYNPNTNDRISRIASVIKLWNVIKNFSIQNLSNSNLDSVLVDGINKASISSENFENVLKSMILITDDLRARTWSSNSEYEFSFPFTIRRVDGKYFVSVNVEPSLGLTTGYEVLKVDDVDIEKYIQDYISLIPGENNDYKIVKALAELRAGKKNSKAKFTVKRIYGDTVDVTAIRNYLFQDVYELKPMEIAELEPGYVYVDMTVMDDNKFKDYIEPLAQRDAFIFDLRGMTTMSEHFLGLLTKDTQKNAKWEIPVYTEPDKALVSTTNFGGYEIAPYGKLAGKKYVFLIDERTSAYAEAIASIVKENHLATIMGRSSAGNASEVFPVRLYGEYSVSLSGLKVYSPNNNLLFNHSIKPDIEIDYQLHARNDKFDSLILKALEYLQNGDK